MQLLLGILVIYSTLVVLIYFFQSKLLFLPEVAGRELLATPDVIGLSFENVYLSTADGVKIHDWFVAAPGSGRSMIFFHGNAGNISHRLDSLRIFNELGLNVLMVEYRGYGASEGKPSEKGTAEDALAAWRYLVGERSIAPESIILFGRSLGAAVAVQLAQNHYPAGLVIESTFKSVPDMGAEIYPWLPVRLLSRIKYDSLRLLSEISCPVMVIHSPQDDIIPFHHGRALFEAANEPKVFMEIRGGHNEGYLLDREGYKEGWRRFLDSL